MKISAVKTHKIEYGESLKNILDTYINELQEKSIIAITSKILSVTQGRYVKKNEIDKYELIKNEADQILETDENQYNIHLTIKNGLLIPSAGIDESNAGDYYLLYPQDMWKITEETWHHLREKFNLSEVGVIITDSHTTIMRRGVVGIGLTWCGFSPLNSYIGKPDLYEQPLKVTKVNVLDSLAVTAVFAMGEGAEQTPLAIIENPPHVIFSSQPPFEEEKSEVLINLKEDLYLPLLKSGEWKKYSKN